MIRIYSSTYARIHVYKHVCTYVLAVVMVLIVVVVVVVVVAVVVVVVVALQPLQPPRLYNQYKHHLYTTTTSYMHTLPLKPLLIYSHSKTVKLQ